MNLSKIGPIIKQLKAAGKGATAIAKELDISVSLVYYHTSKSRDRNLRRLAKVKSDNRQRAFEYKGGQCQKPGCGYSKCLAAMAYHHKDPLQKDLRISGAMCNWETLRVELDKTILLCCRCHQELHAGLWSDAELTELGLIYIPSGYNTGKLILPPSKRKRATRGYYP